MAARTWRREEDRCRCNLGLALVQGPNSPRAPSLALSALPTVKGKMSYDKRMMSMTERVHMCDF